MVRQKVVALFSTQLPGVKKRNVGVNLRIVKINKSASMCHANAKEMVGIKRQCLMDKGKDLNSNYVDSAARAHAGKYKELTTIGNAELW